LQRDLPIAVTAVIVAAAACAPAPPRVALPSDFETTIARLEAQDPGSPEALNARLQYADFLAKDTGGDCGKQLDAAQVQLDAVTRRPALPVLLPLGAARLANGAYAIRAARAVCDASRRTAELEQALDAARQAVGLYRDGLDYQSSAIMQFNAAAALHDLGDQDGAQKALEAAIAMDRDYGFRDDAADNIRLLQHWRGEDESDTKIAELMKDFPARTADFKFHWSSTDADVEINVDDTSMIDGKIIRSRGSVGLKRHVRADPMGWTVSNEPGTIHYELGDWPADARKSQWTTMYFMARALLQAPNIVVGKDGEFRSVANPQAFGTNLATEVSPQISAQVGEITSDAAPGSADAIMHDLSPAFSQEFIDSSAMQDYGLQTGTWIGAKLAQGVWYQMSTPLFLPRLGLGHYLVQYDVNFAFTHQVPCKAESPDHLCAEIVVHATPDASALKATLEEAGRQLKISDKRSLHGWSVTDLRLVVDPDTLLPYICDTRQYWYAAIDRAGSKSDPVIESERIVSTSRPTEAREDQAR
jgi:tetratricopeptide (TPR) repeat protein